MALIVAPASGTTTSPPSPRIFRRDLARRGFGPHTQREIMDTTHQPARVILMLIAVLAFVTSVPTDVLA